MIIYAHGDNMQINKKQIETNREDNLCRFNKHIRYLEEDWAIYKYAILERSPSIYQKIRVLLLDKNQYPVEDFYHLIDLALKSELTIGRVNNAANHVYGYFKNLASPHEKTEYNTRLNAVNIEISKLHSLKEYLYELAIKYQQKYLLASLYFYD